MLQVKVLLPLFLSNFLCSHAASVLTAEDFNASLLQESLEKEFVFQTTDPCETAVIGKLCGNETFCTSSGKGFKCECMKGYFKRSSYGPVQDAVIDICEDIDECLDPSICPSTTTCVNLPGEYTCTCKDGYRLKEGAKTTVDGCTAVCDPNPCLNGGSCSVCGRDGYSCRCTEGFTGLKCENKIETKSNNEAHWLIVLRL